MRKVDLTNRQFGSLIVQHEAPIYISPAGHRKVMWHCICSCGNECDVMASHLLSGHTQSCGCQKLDGLKPRTATDLTGRKFGQLTVLYRMPNRMVQSNSRVVWHCRCDCGNESDVLALLLTGGLTKSCGCKSVSHAERTLAQYLSEKNVLFETEYHPSGLYSHKGGLLRYDFAVYTAKSNELALLIELDGAQHHAPIAYFGGEWKYRNCVANDAMKNTWANENHVCLVRLDVSKCTTDASFRKLYHNNLSPYLSQINK